VLRPDQNPALKRAWADLGLDSLYGQGSPFRDESKQNKKRIIMSLTHPNQRICLAMALTGKCYSNCRGKHDELTAAEVQKVGQEGGLTLSS